MAGGKQLEKNLENIIRQFFTLKYWTSRSGVQDGSDAYAKFKINSKEYIWKFECKDHNAQKHRENFDSLKEIEISDFSDKIMQIMARGRPYPHVFCLFIPHKVIGKNNRLREAIDSWNLYNKFPFKITVWDFNFLKDIIPNINLTDADLIYPNAPDKDKSRHNNAISELLNELEQQSIDGYFHNRSYIRERLSKSSLLIDNVLHIKVIKPVIPKGKAQELEFVHNGKFFRCLYNDILNITINHYPVQARVKKIASVNIKKRNNELVSDKTETEIIDKLFDDKEYARLIDENKDKLLTLFKQMKNNKDSSETLFGLIHNFCKRYNHGVVSFIVPKDIKLASIPIKELNAKDFNSKNSIHFYFEFKDN